MTSATDRRLTKLEHALSPTEAVLAWLADAQQFATSGDQAWAIAALPVESARLEKRYFGGRDVFFRDVANAWSSHVDLVERIAGLAEAMVLPGKPRGLGGSRRVESTVSKASGAYRAHPGRRRPSAPTRSWLIGARGGDLDRRPLATDVSRARVASAWVPSIWPPCDARAVGRHSRSDLWRYLPSA